MQEIGYENDNSFNRVSQTNGEPMTEKEHPSPISSLYPSQVSQVSLHQENDGESVTKR
jgi:hypothetical protein